MIKLDWDSSRKGRATGERKRRSLSDPTGEWFRHAHELYQERGEHASYFEGRFGDIFERVRRGALELEEGKTSLTF